MKKVILSAFVAVAAISGVYGYFNQPTSEELNALTIANVDALTQIEVVGGCLHQEESSCILNGYEYQDSEPEYYEV